MFLHGFKFLLLIVGEHGFDGVVRAFHDGSCLSATVFRSEGLVLEEGLHLLLAFLEKWLDLVLLIRSEIEHPREVLQLTIGIHAHATGAGPLRWRSGLILIGRRGRGVLCEGGARAQSEKAAEG